MTVVDVHSHLFPRDLALPVTGGPWPRLDIAGDGTGQLLVGDAPFRDVTAPLWDVAARIEVLDTWGVERQVVSPVPFVLDTGLHADAVPDSTAVFFGALNAGIAAAVAEAPDRLTGLGAVPGDDPQAAVAALRHAVSDLGLAGIEIGCRVGGRELDDPALRPLFRAADELGALVFVHPAGGGAGALRRTGQPYDFGLGMLTDTALAASALLFGGVLDECPGLEVLLAHGGGTFPWALPRLSKGSVLGGDLSNGDHEKLARRLWVDTLVFDPQHLALLAQRYGDEHVVFGSDYPFIPGQLEGARALVEQAVASGAIEEATGAGVLSGNGLRLVGGCGAHATGTVQG